MATSREEFLESPCCLNLPAAVLGFVLKRILVRLDKMLNWDKDEMHYGRGARPTLPAWYFSGPGRWRYEEPPYPPDAEIKSRHGPQRISQFDSESSPPASSGTI